MKKIGIIIGVLILLVVGAGLFVMLERNECSFENPGKCDYSCETKTDCHVSNIQCVNVKETFKIPEGVRFDVVVNGCDCVDNKCENLEVIDAA
jgi:hypothetical protein